MPQFFIPRIGQHFQIQEDWTFELQNEHRNTTVVAALLPELQVNDRWGNYNERRLVTLAAGTILSISRIYIRTGQAQYDSITFNIIDSPDPRLGAGKLRFWANLDAVNGIDVRWIEPVKRRKVTKVSKRAVKPAETAGAITVNMTDLIPGN